MMVISSHILVKSTINDLNQPLDPLNFRKYRLNETLKWDNITFFFLMIKLIWKCYLKYRSTKLLNWTITVLVTTCTLKVGIEDDSSADSSDFFFSFFLMFCYLDYQDYGQFLVPKILALLLLLLFDCGREVK